MANRTSDKALSNLDRVLKDREQQQPIPFEEFLEVVVEKPQLVVRNVFQLFHDLIKSHFSEGVDEYPDDPESIHYVYYDCTKLFVEEADNPFFADRLFANRLVNTVEAMRRSAQQNQIYIFEGPHGSGKSTFLNNLLEKLEKFANTEQGQRYEAVWRLDRGMLGSFREGEAGHFLEKLSQLLDRYELDQQEIMEVKNTLFSAEDYVEIPCPSHDNPLLMIDKLHRRAFFDDLLPNAEFKYKLFNDKEYEWILRGQPCTICSSLYHALLLRLRQPSEVLKMLYARPYLFNRRLGEGISVFNPGDKPVKETVLENPMLQTRIDHLLRDSTQVRYIFSRYAKTNDGVYALMDIKSHNVERLIELHNIISEGVHKVGDMEENVNSLLLAVMNPEDRKNIEDIQSFLDRIEYIKIPYVLDLNTEVQIYRNIFGRHIDEVFLPRVLHNFARLIIASRLNTKSEAMKEWVENPEKYRLYCDENLLLLKMEIFTGHIPGWLSTEDRKRLTARRRRKIIGESEKEGTHGFSGRDAIKIFNDFHSTYARKDSLITMSDLCNFFVKKHRGLQELIPDGFLDSLVRMYDYSVLQEVKESLYLYNEQQVTRELQNYLFAVNFEPGTVATCSYTGDRLEVSEELFSRVEDKLLGPDADPGARQRFRTETQREYTAHTLTQEIMGEGKELAETKLFASLLERYLYQLKEKVLEPLQDNENFRRAIKDYGREEFKTYDQRIRDDISFMIDNLCQNFGYTKRGARAVCIYVIDNELPRKFGNG